MTRPAALLLCLLMGLAAAASCTRVQARMPPPAPPVALDTPVPPPPLIIPVDDPPDRPADPPPPTAPAPTSGDNRTTSPPRATVTPPPPTPPPAADPPSVLRPSVNVAQLVAETNQLLQNAERDLAAAGTRPLSRDAKEQHRTAIRFVGMARYALESKNYSAALATAKKAAAIAGLLVRGEPLPTAP